MVSRGALVLSHHIPSVHCLSGQVEVSVSATPAGARRAASIGVPSRYTATAPIVGMFFVASRVANGTISTAVATGRLFRGYHRPGRGNAGVLVRSRDEAF